MVKISRRVSRKRHLGKEKEYERFSLVIPKRFHDVVESFLGRDLSVDVKRRRNMLTITLCEKPS